MPKYDEYVKPNVDLYVIPVFNKYLVPTYVTHVEPLVDSALVLWKKQISPVISEKLGQIKTVYDENLAPKVAELWENTKPKLINAYDIAIVYARTLYFNISFKTHPKIRVISRVPPRSKTPSLKIVSRYLAGGYFLIHLCHPVVFNFNFVLLFIKFSF